MPAEGGGPPKDTKRSVITMSYLRNRKPATAMGDIASTITNIANTVGIAGELANDPYLPETICRVGQVKQINAGQRPGACAKTADNLGGGVGLRMFIKPLRGVVYAEQNKWVYPAAIAVGLGLPFLLGYALGRK